jgi:uncharacterized repeat protein (TIGR01451 family)
MNRESDSESFEALCRELLKNGLSVRFEARGASMSPCIRDRQIVHVTPVTVSKLRKGDIVLTKGHSGFRLHRLVRADQDNDLFITRGDCGQQDDPPVRGHQILGVVVAKEVRLGKTIVRTKLKGIGGILLRGAARGQSATSKLVRAVRLRRSSSAKVPRDPVGSYRIALALFLMMLAAPSARGQVAVDSTSSASASLTGAGTKTVTFAHTTTTTANRVLVVGISINITNAPTTAVTGVTYDGTALTLAGSHNDAGETRRVEMWYLLAPVNGTFNVVVSVDIPAAFTEGVAVGATTFTGVDQTVPVSSLASADGAAGNYSQLNVPSVVNGMILDTLATDGTQTVTVPGPQALQWNLQSQNNTNPGVRASGSSRTGAPSVPVSETFSGTSNWSLGAVSINPTAADIGVATTVGSAVFLGQSTTYNITVFNNGTSAANNVELTDALAAGMTLNSVTPSAGTTCTGVGPITCTLPTPFAGGATATVAVVETATASGAFTNMAVVSDSGTPPDPNTGNNTFVAVATVQSVACAGVSQVVAGTNLSSVLNTYYPGSASVAAGATSITVGAATGGPGGVPAAVAAGDLLLVIQMQDASINDSDTVAYGNGYTGQGFTALNSTGDYEFVTAQNAVPAAGGTLTIVGAGAGGGLIFPYHSAAASATAGQSTYQVIVVPQYTTASFNATTPPTAQAWNGSTGGVLTLDTSGTLTLGGATVVLDGLGFRGGAGMQLTGGGGANTDYRQPSPATYTGAVGGEAGWDAPKGEGIAGTPEWVETGGTFLHTNTGYPSGTAGTDGSMARGAPGNAGAGGTDADPQTASPNGNDQNAGGGGGSNGGAGGFGGDSWNTNLSLGGEGGTAFPATINRIAMGGGGGAGSRNNDDGNNQASGGATGGGIIIIRTFALSGTGTFTANGVSAYNLTANDAGGGGGAGGSIVILSANGGEGGLTLQANGGNGGNAWASETFTLANRHGPGGGGGGGVILVSGTPASASINGGTNGVTENPGVAYGSTPGTAGVSVTNQSITQPSGTQSGAQCITPDMTLGKSHLGNFTRGSTATYTIPVENLSPLGSSSGTVTMNDTLPLGLTPTSATGPGWACSIASQTVSCTDSTPLAANSFYPSITVIASVAQTAPSTETNTALISGGGEVNLANDSATDVATVVSSADLSVTNAVSPDPVAAGSNLTYTQVVTNNGPSAADNATLVQAIPANTTLVSLSAPAGWSCTTPGVGNTGSVVCTDLNLAGNTAATFTLITKVNAAAANGTVITDTAMASSSVTDPNSANNTASASTIVGTTAGAELSVTNAASPDPVQASNNITYTQVVTNSGTAAATGATFSETTPANTTLVSMTAAAGWTCTGFPPLCTNASVAAGSTGMFTVIYKVAAGTTAGTIITDTVTVNAGNQAFGSNSATATDVVATAVQADLALSTAASPTTVLAGNDIAYTQTVTNNGPAAATNVVFTEAIPTNTTFVSVSAPAGWSCTTTTSIVCNDASMASATSASIIVVVNVAPTVAATTITAASSVSSSTSDPYSANNSTTVNTPVTTACDLAVTNTGTPSPVLAGGTITYTQVVTNNGPSNCSTVGFSEAIPANTTFSTFNGAPPGWTCPSFVTGCTNPSLAPGSISTFVFSVIVKAGTAAGTIITDTDTATTTSYDTNLNNNSATLNIPVAGAGQADLSVTNSPSPNPVSAGGNITYTQTVTNGGPAAASTITFTETAPANTTAQSLTGPAGWACNLGTLTCTIASLAANTTANFTFVVTVNTSVASGSTITQTDSVTCSASDPSCANNTASSSVLVAASADLSVTNTATPVPVRAGNNITYTQVVRNAGPSTATGVSFTETTPPNTTFVSLTPIPGGWSCILPTAGGTGSITCTNPSFATGTASFPVIVGVAAGTAAGTAINDTATVSSTTTDPNSANNTATAADVVATATQADLITTNTATPTSVAAGSTVSYTQSVTNNGPAAATAPSFTQTTPPNTNFQSITPPAGWTCTKPPVGAAGTITCTATTLAFNATANFTLVLQVNAATASGTNIAETATANAANIVPTLTTNSATATVVVANANSANVTIAKSATPSPTVASGDLLTYTLKLKNTGPATATTVTVTDPLPPNVLYQQSSTTVGTCSEAGGTVTCQLGTMTNGTTATVTILTLASAPGTATNTASVTADQMTSPNTSTQVETITFATSIKLEFFTAQRGKDTTGANRVVLLWKTGGEAHNLGFNVYREQSGERVPLNPSLIAGSALLMNGALPKHSGRTYTWIDSSPGAASGSYWLEDVDVNGTRTLHGPIFPSASGSASADSEATSAIMMNQLNQAQPAAALSNASHPAENAWREIVPTSAQSQQQFNLAARPAVKISVKHEGWYCIAQPQLIQAGLDSNVDPSLLHLYAEAIEQPIQITGASSGSGGFGPQSEICFYGTGINTQYSDARVYWLAAEESQGQRIQDLPLSTGSNQPPSGFPFTVELTPHTTYFSALTTAHGNNFFGPLVSSTAVDETVQVHRLDPTSTRPAQLEVILQGVILAFPHDVSIVLNGTTLGDLTFIGQVKGKFTVDVPPGLLQNGANTVTLTAQNGEFDYSLLQSIRIIYPHSYVADSGSLTFTGRAGDELKISGFTQSTVTVLDITNPAQPVQLTTQVAPDAAPKTDYVVNVQVPWSTGNSAVHTLIAVETDRIASAAGIQRNHPSHWHSAQPGSEIVMISPGAFAGALASLVHAHQAEGKSAAVVWIDDLYDEFNFGERSPAAIREFLQTAVNAWHTAPRYVLLNGRASLDPRNYLGFGYLDFVPTKIVPTTGLMTASDDWFSDFSDSGMPTIATGRLPVSTLAEAQLVAGRIATYEGQSTNGPWTSQALMVADVNDTLNFTKYSQIVQAQLPSTIQVTDVFATSMSIPDARQAILTAINSGQVLVNYSGHGSEDEWSGDGLFDSGTATALTNGNSLPVFLIMDCLNGFFQDVYEEPLAVALMLAPNGGAVAVLASSGLNQAPPQTNLDKLVVQATMNSPQPTLGDAILQAKSGIADLSVRKTYNLLGDPAMQIKLPAANPAH